MALATSVRVESIAPTSNVVRWAYAGSSSIRVYRSTDGVIYAVTGDPVAVGTLIFTDVGLAADTKYYYKLSDDSGATFSSVVTVVTHDCQDDGGAALTQGVNLPRGTQEFDDAMRRIEDAFNRDDLQGSEPCPACVDTEGKVVLDCSSGCGSFEIDVDVDVNSITIKNCKEVPVVDWNCPGDRADCGVSGWPATSPFGGDEGNKARIAGGRTATTGGGGNRSPRTKPGPQNRNLGGGGGGGGFGGSTCQCVPSLTNILAIKCCTADCSMGCSGAKSLDIKVCGGKGPYTITGTGSVNIKRASGTAVGSGTIKAGETISITPPTNSGGAVAGTAWVRVWYSCNDNPCPSGVCSGTRTDGHEDFKCDDTQDNGCFAPGAGHVHCSTASPAANTMICSGVGATCLPACASGCVGVPVVCDERTAQMITDGCNPCGVSAAGKVITVTDSLGNSVAKTLRS